MPTKYPRISVTKDPELASALERVGELEEAPRGEARLVHDLALLGARARLQEERRRRQLVEAFIERTMTPGRIDVEALERLRGPGWGREPLP